MKKAWIVCLISLAGLSVLFFALFAHGPHSNPQPTKLEDYEPQLFTRVEGAFLLTGEGVKKPLKIKLPLHPEEVSFGAGPIPLPGYGRFKILLDHKTDIKLLELKGHKTYFPRELLDHHDELAWVGVRRYDQHVTLCLYSQCLSATDSGDGIRMVLKEQPDSNITLSGFCAGPGFWELGFDFSEVLEEESTLVRRYSGITKLTQLLDVNRKLAEQDVKAELTLPKGVFPGIEGAVVVDMTLAVRLVLPEKLEYK